ncbi:MAG: hypothetical protein IKM04_06210 [Clostridia bacterium]|nr:hypothetical protein [Clostridia bacterium]
MKKSAIFGMIAGFAVGTASAIAGRKAYDKVSKEIKDDFSDQVFTSPEGNNAVTLSLGSSESARGLTCIKVKATSESIDDECKLIIFTFKKGDIISGEWSDNGNFRLLIGNGKRKQCCDVSFEEDRINALYYLLKNA